MSEVTQAAERLRRWKDDVFTCNMEQVGKDRTLLADQWLQEHASDDDEPITEAWLSSLFQQRTANVWRAIGCYVSIYGNTIYAETLVNRESIREVTTRGQLRLLIRALS